MSHFFCLKNTSMLSKITPGWHYASVVFIFQFAKACAERVAGWLLSFPQRLRFHEGFGERSLFRRSPTQNDLCTHLCPDKCIGEQVTRRTLQWSVDSVEDICHLKFIQVKNESAKCHQASFHITRRARRGCITSVSWVKWAPSDWLKWASEVGGSVKRALLKNYKRWAIAVTCSYHFFSFTIRGCWWFIWENCWSVQIKWSGMAEWSVSSLLTTISVAFPWTLPLL